MWNQRPSFRFEIDNFSDKEAEIASQIFVSGGCEWYLYVYPKGDGLTEDHLSLYLYVENTKLLRTGWQRSANYYFTVLNQSDKEIYRSSRWGFSKTLLLSKFQDKRFLENDRLIIEVYIKIIEVVDRECINVSEQEETVDINGFQVFASQVTSVRKIFVEHPDIAEEFKPKSQLVKTAYINVLLNLIEKLHKPSQNLSQTELRNAHDELNELMEVGFKLEWLKAKLEEVSLEMKKTNTDGLRIQQLEERVKYLELTVSDLKVELDVEKAKFATTTAQVLLLEQTLSDLKVETEKERANTTTSTEIVLSSEDDDLFSHSKFKGIQHRRYGYKRIN